MYKDDSGIRDPRAHRNRLFGRLCRLDYSWLFSYEEGHGHERSKGLRRTRGRREAFRLADAWPLLCAQLLGRDTDERIMMFEETLPPGTASLYHLHHESDEVARVLAGEFSFKIGDEITAGGPGTCAFMPRDIPHAWKNTGSETGRVLFLYTPAAAEDLSRRSRSAAQATTKNTPNFSSATAGKSSAQTRFEGTGNYS